MGVDIWQEEIEYIYLFNCLLYIGLGSFWFNDNLSNCLWFTGVQSFRIFTFIYFTFIIASTVNNKLVVSREHILTPLSFRGRVLFFISVLGFVNSSYLQRQMSDSTTALFQFQYSTVKAGDAGPSS